MSIEVGTLLVNMAANVAGLRTDMDRAAQAVERGARRIDSAAKVARTALGAIGIGLSAAGIAGFFKRLVLDTANAADALDEMSQKVGVGVEQIQEYTLAVQTSGMTMQDFEGALIRFSRSIDEARLGTQESVEAFQRLGISLTDNEGRAKTTNELFREVAGRFSEMRDGATKTGIAMTLFSRSGAQLIPVLNQGNEALDEWGRKARDAGLVIKEDVVKRMAAFTDELDILKGRLKGVAIELAGPIVKALSDFIEQLRVGTEAAGGFWKAVFRYGTAGTDPEAAIARTTARIAELQAQIAKDEGTKRFFGGSGSRELAQRRTAAAREEIAQLERDLVYFRTLSRQRIPDDVNEAMRVLGGDIVPRRPTPDPDPGGGGGKKRPTIKAAELTEEQRLLTETAALWMKAEQAADAYAAKLGVLDQLFFRGAISIEQYDRALAELSGAQAQAGADGGRELDDLARKWVDLIDPTAQYVRQLEEIRRLQRAGKLSGAQALEAEFKVQEKIQEALGGVVDSTKDAKDAAKDLGMTFQSALEDVILEGGKARDVIGALVEDMARVAIRKKLIEPLVGWAVSLFAADGKVFDRGRVQPFAAGGVVDRPTAFPFAGGVGLMGEAGPEAIMPLKRGRDGKLGVSAQRQAPNITIQQSFTFNGATTRSEAFAIVEAARRQTLNDIREANRRGNTALLGG